VTKNYQTNAPMTSAELRHAMPETVSVSMAEIAEDMREGLLALAVGTGLQVMQALMAEDVTAVCGPKGKHDPGPDRDPARHRGRLGHLGWPSGAGDQAEDARQRRFR
jgi:putative transposase